MKSNIKSEKFYVEAEDLQEGWGKYLRKIDELKDKVMFKKNITLSEYLWTLYGDGWCSYVYLKFKQHANKIKYGKRKMLRECWQGLFDSWFEKHKETI